MSSAGVISYTADRNDHHCDFVIKDEVFPEDGSEHPYFPDETYVEIRKGLVAARLNYNVHTLSAEVVGYDEEHEATIVRIRAEDT